MGESQNCPAPVLFTSDSNVVPNENKSCHARVESIFGNSTSLGILEEFQHIYEERLRKIDKEMGGEGMELKLKTLRSWVNDLGEQNQMLVETVEQLEREAGGRVALLEERLRKSSHVALEYMSKLEEFDNQIWGLSEGKVVPMLLPLKASNGVVQAQQTEEILKTRLTNLQNDISGLLELIRRARCEGSWNTNGISFTEVTYEDIFGSRSHQISCDTRKSIGFDTSMEPKIHFGNHELDLPSWKPKTSLESEEIQNLTKKLEDVNSILQTTLKDNERLVKEIDFLSDELKSKTDRNSALSQNISEMDKNELEYRITDLEATYLRLERSWDHAWEISKSKALDDLVYYENALQEGNTGGSKSCTFDIPEKMTWCTAGIKKDQEKIRELCGEIKSLLQSSQQCTVKRGVSFASPSKEDYKLQVQELQKALKQAQNGVELARKQMTKNIIGLKALRSKCTPVTNYNQEQSYSRKMKDVNINENVYTYETILFPLSKNYEQDLLADNEPRLKVNLEKKLLLHEKMSESQLKVIENLQGELGFLQRRNKELQESVKERQHRKYGNFESNIKEQLNDQNKEYEIKLHSLECDLFLAEVMIYEKNKIIQTLAYKLKEGTRMVHLNHKEMEKNKFDCGDLDQYFDINRYFTDMSQSDLQESQYGMGKELEKFSVFTFQRCTHCNTSFNKKNDAFNIMEKLHLEIETLKSTVSANDKVILDQQEMLNIQQEALTLSQEEVRELQSQIRKLECSNEDESKQVQEQLITISNLHRDLITTKHLLQELEEESHFYVSFEDEEKKNKALQSKCQDFERKFKEAKEYWLYLFQQSQKIEEEINKCDNQQTKVIKIIINVIACIKYFCLKYFVEEEIVIRDDVHCGLEDHGPFELVQIFSNNEDNTVNANEGTGAIGGVNLVSKSSMEEFESLNLQNSVRGMPRITDSFKNIHLNELRKVLDAQTSQMSPNEFGMRGQINYSDLQTKVENMETALIETSENRKSSNLDYGKYQEQMENAAEKEVVLQEDFTAKERNLWEKVHQGQAESLNNADALHTLNEEIDLLQGELNERDSQLQSSASSLRSLRALSIESSLLQKELQKQETNVEKLEEQLLKNNIKLQKALSYLDEKNNLLQKLNKENHNMQDRLMNLEIKFQNSISTERHTFHQEISNLKLSIQQLKILHEKSNLEIREHWWWDDGWQIW